MESVSKFFGYCTVERIDIGKSILHSAFPGQLLEKYE